MTVKFLSWRKAAILLAAYTLAAIPAHAAVVISGTRVIFPAKEGEVTVDLRNEGRIPVLVQAWLDTGDANAAPETIKVPFTISPALFRIDSGKGQTVRLVYTGEPLATDRETLYWFNVLEVPPKEATKADSQMRFAFRTRIKVMFRPSELPGKAEDAPAQVSWRVVQDPNGNGFSLRAANPTPYVVNLGDVAVKSDGKSYPTDSGFILPFDSKVFPAIQNLREISGPLAIDYQGINDWGGSQAGTAVAIAAP